MKKAIIAIALGALALVGTASQADARPCGGRGYNIPANTIYVSGYRHGRPVYTEKIFIGYDCHGYPRFTYRTVYSPPRRHVEPCRPAYTAYRHDPYGRSGATVSFTFRR